MIASLRGTLVFAESRSIVIECSGVGFKCQASDNTIRQLDKIGSEVFVHTHMTVREDALELCAFADNNEMSMFKVLINVNGVSARLAVSLLSEYDTDRLALFIASGDSKALTKASGIGAKLAQRIVLETKDKLSAADVGISDDANFASAAAANSATAEAVSALVSLGFTQTDASVAVGKLDKSLPVEALIKEALKQLSRQV